MSSKKRSSRQMIQIGPTRCGSPPSPGKDSRTDRRLAQLNTPGTSRASMCLARPAVYSRLQDEHLLPKG